MALRIEGPTIGFQIDLLAIGGPLRLYVLVRRVSLVWLAIGARLVTILLCKLVVEDAFGGRLYNAVPRRSACFDCRLIGGLHRPQGEPFVTTFAF